MVVADRFQGPTGFGQGGYAGGLLAERLGGVVGVDFHRPILLDTALELSPAGNGLSLTLAGKTVVRAAPSSDPIRPAPFVDLPAAVEASRGFPGWDDNPVPDCFSCGIRPGSFEVHPGPVAGTDLYATPWTPPMWAAGTDGTVAVPFVWGAIDCPSGWRATTVGERRNAVTGRLEVEIVGAVQPGETYVLVAWADRWKGRRTTAGTSLFSSSGRTLARSQAMWIATPGS